MGMEDAGIDLEEASKCIRPSKDTILVFGTGISTALTNGSYPQLSWLGLIKSGFDYAVKIGKLSATTAENWLRILKDDADISEILHLAGFLSQALSTGDGFDYAKWLEKEFSDIAIYNKELSRTIKDISNSGIKFCTLNYDSLLESATELPPIYMDETNEVIGWFKGERKGILHLHGHWKRPDTCILGAQHYQTTIFDSTRIFFQQHLTVFGNLLFVGCGGTFEDPNFTKTLSWLREELQPTKSSIFALVRNSEVGSRRTDAAWQNIIEPIGFGSDHDLLGPFLEALFLHVTAPEPKAYPNLSADTAIQRLDQVQHSVALDNIHAPLPSAPQAHNVRHAQLFQAEQILKLSRCLWLIADWGMGEDEFISALVARLGKKTNKLYSVNISNYTQKSSFYNQIEEILGASFKSFCNSLSLIDQAYLVLRDAPLDTYNDKNRIDADLLSLTEIMTSFCPNLRIILTSRNLPSWKPGVVELTALDGADTRAYIESHPLYQGGLENADFTQLYELTNGFPRAIRDAIDKLSVASLEEIVGEREASRFNLTGRFGDSIKALSAAQEIEKRYAFSLLKSLSAFPYGEYLDNIKRVDKSKKYAIDHAVILQREGFIYVEDQDSLGHTGTRASKKRLIVTLPARHWLTQELKTKEITKLKKQAYSLYFGESWETLDPKLHPIFKASDISEKSSEVNNAKYFITDIVAEGRTNERWRTVGIELASQFSATVGKKSYYKVVQDLYISLKPMLNDINKDQKYWFFIYVCAQSIRMIGGKANKDEALQMLLDCLDNIDQQNMLGTIKLQIAMIYSSRGVRTEAIKYATQAKKHGKGSVAMQASHILLKNSDLATKDAEILKIEEKAKTKASTLYSNIVLDRCDELEESPKKVEILKDLVDYCHEKKDLYNEIRAAISHAESFLKIHHSLDSENISRLIKIYHHLHHDDMNRLHARCHKILWTAFYRNEDHINLFQLFKYSSLYWRLRDEQQAELDAVKKFEEIDINKKISKLEPAASYYYGRLATIAR